MVISSPNVLGIDSDQLAAAAMSAGSTVSTGTANCSTRL
jgi:hypothetical protein